MAAVAGGYVPLEIEPETGLRGGRMREISSLMRLLTGAEETLVVNNNAAAVLLTLSAMASGKSVIVSRGEAVEIGGGFRIPDVLAAEWGAVGRGRHDQSNLCQGLRPGDRCDDRSPAQGAPEQLRDHGVTAAATV